VPYATCYNASLDGLPVRAEAVVLGPVIESHVQPRDPGTSSAEPDGLDPDTPSHGLADCTPEGVPLSVGSLSNERGEMTVGGRCGDGARHNHDRVTAEVGEHHHFRMWGAVEVLGKRRRVGAPCQTGAVQQNELEGPAQRGGGHGWHLPAEGPERCLS